MATLPELKMVIRPKWWLRFYICGVAITSVIFDCEINEARFLYWVMRGSKAYLVLPGGKLRRVF